MICSMILQKSSSHTSKTWLKTRWNGPSGKNNTTVISSSTLVNQNSLTTSSTRIIPSGRILSLSAKRAIYSRWNLKLLLNKTIIKWLLNVITALKELRKEMDISIALNAKNSNADFVCMVATTATWSKVCTHTIYSRTLYTKRLFNMSHQLSLMMISEWSSSKQQMMIAKMIFTRVTWLKWFLSCHLWQKEWEKISNFQLKGG